MAREELRKFLKHFQSEKKKKTKKQNESKFSYEVAGMAFEQYKGLFWRRKYGRNQSWSGAKLEWDSFSLFRLSPRK
jgi:hypothetical protein